MVEAAFVTHFPPLYPILHFAPGYFIYNIIMYVCQFLSYKLGHTKLIHCFTGNYYVISICAWTLLDFIIVDTRHTQHPVHLCCVDGSICSE